MGGAPQRVIIDNTHRVVLRGSGKHMEPVPEMTAFAERFGARRAAVPLYRKQLSGRPDIR